jgi:hypothetical protein
MAKLVNEVKVKGKLAVLDHTLADFRQKVMVGDVKGALERAVQVNADMENVVKALTGTEVV